MKNTRFKKVLSLLLAVLLLSAVPMSVAEASDNGYPLIIIPDMTDIVLYSSPNTLQRSEVFNTDSQNFLSAAVKIVAGLVAAAFDKEKGANQVATGINEMLGDITCDEHGNSKNTKLGVENGKSPAAYLKAEENIYTENVAAFIKAADGIVDEDHIFVFQYDWRLDPLENADSLADYIEDVKTWTKKSKVAIISGGAGGNVVNAYLYSWSAHAQECVSSCVFLDSAATGNSIIGDIMSGDLVNTVLDELEDITTFTDYMDVYDALTGADVGDAFVRFLEQDPGGIITKIFSNVLKDSSYAGVISWIALKIAGYILEDQGYFDDFGKGYKELLVLNKDGIYTGGLSDILRNMPGMWALIPEEQYEDALEFMFGGADNIDEELYQKIVAYRTVMRYTERTLKNASANGINVSVVAGYNVQILPITASIKEQSDGFSATRYAGFGATTGDIDSTVTLAKQCGYGNHNHMEPSKMVDASTCYLPENTWFIKGHNHMDYASDTAAEFVIWLATATSQRNIWQNDNFPQYMQEAIIGGKIYAYSTPSDSEKNTYTYGDLDIDGSISASDARIAMRYAVGLEKNPSKIMILVGDVDGDGKITVADARLMLRYSVAIDNSFEPAE